MKVDVYRAVWRWHFFAGLIVLPFLLWLAVTGGAYLFKPEIERALYRDWIELPAERSAMDASAVVSSVERQLGGSVTQVERSVARAESWRMRVDTAQGPRTAFVDPGSGAVLGTMKEGGFMKLVRDLHGLAITGPIGNALIEIAAGWAIILCLTGFYLWWPGKGQPALALRRPTERRRFWKDLHASTGAIGGLVVLFLATTGMPWSVVWGDQLQQLVAQQGWGRPAAPNAQPGSHGGHHGGAQAARTESLPWSMQARPEPVASVGGASIGLSGALRIAAQNGMAGDVTVNLPGKAGQPFMVSRKVVSASDARVLFIDPANARVLQDARYADFGGGAQIIEWGVMTHQGQEYGEVNRWVMLAGCISIVILVISAPVLWWKRRTDNRLRSPPRALDKTKGRTVTLLVAFAGILFPLAGITIAITAAGDWWFGRRKSRLAG